MRKHIPSQVALEDAPVAVQMLSLEEEAIEAAEQATEAGEIAQDLSEADRVIEISDALEDLAAVAGSIEEATPAETQLVEIAGQMAVAGTDVSPEEIVPAMEAFVLKKIDTAAMYNTAKQIWERILNYVKQIWEKIANFVKRVVGAIPRLRRNIEELEEKIDAVESQKAEGKIELYAGLTALSVNGSPVANHGDLSKALKDLHAASKFVFGNVVDNTIERGKAVESSIKAFDPAKSAESVTALRAAFRSVKVPNAPGAAGADAKRFPGFETRVGTPLLGNVSIAFKAYTDKGDSGDLGALERYRNSGFALVPSADKLPDGKPAQFEPLTPAAMKATLKSVLELLDTLEEFESSGKNKAIQTQKKAIEAASSEAAKAMAKYAPENEGDKQAATTNFRAALNMNTGFTKWAAGLTVPFMTNALKSARASVVLVQRSLAAYK